MGNDRSMWFSICTTANETAPECTVGHGFDCRAQDKLMNSDQKPAEAKTGQAGVNVLRSIVWAIALSAGCPTNAAEVAGTSAGMEPAQRDAGRAASEVTPTQWPRLQSLEPSGPQREWATRIPGAFEFDFGVDGEVELSGSRNADLDNGLADDFLVVELAIVFASFSYRPSSWFETRAELHLERAFALKEEDFVLLPDGSFQEREDRPWHLFFDEIVATIESDRVPFQLSAGRRKFEDERHWLYDATLDSLVFALQPDDFRFEASVSRENLVDLDLAASEQDSRINNWSLYTEYRGIQRNRLAAYWFHRRDIGNSTEAGRPQFLGLSAQGQPFDRFDYWMEAAYLRGTDEMAKRLSGYGFDGGATYRFLDTPLQPSITLGFAYGSGDDDTDDGENSRFRQTGLQSNESKFAGDSEFKIYGEVLDPELSNLRIYTAAIGVQPVAGVFGELVYHRYEMNEISDEIHGSALSAEPNRIDARPSRNVGSALDLVVEFRNLFDVRDLDLDLRIGVFFPGDAYITDGGGSIINADKGASLVAKFSY